MRAEYILRLDDACPTMDGERWGNLAALLTERGVKPIVAVVPANADPDLVRGPVNEQFWQQARTWATAGWLIAMHGYSHELRPSFSGIVPGSRAGEFIELSLEEQKRRIREGVRILTARGITPEAWVAPAHGMDLNTLEALRAESSIRVISDSFARRPVMRWGFAWLPQQLWRPRSMPPGLWTICLHPNEMQRGDIAHLSRFLDDHPNAFPDPREAASRAARRSFFDAAFEAAFASMLKVRRLGERNG